MRTPRLAIALVLAIVGLVWTGQGLGYIGGSFMTGSLFWAGVGIVVIALAVAMVAWERYQAARR